MMTLPSWSSRKADHAGAVEGCNSPTDLQIEFVPVLCGSALKKIGVQYLVDAVVDYLPRPLDIPPAMGMDPDTGRADGSADR